MVVAQFSLYVHEGSLKPHLFHFIWPADLLINWLDCFFGWLISWLVGWLVGFVVRLRVRVHGLRRVRVPEPGSP